MIDFDDLLKRDKNIYSYKTCCNNSVNTDHNLTINLKNGYRVFSYKSMISSKTIILDPNDNVLYVKQSQSMNDIFGILSFLSSDSISNNEATEVCKKNTKDGLVKITSKEFEQACKKIAGENIYNVLESRRDNSSIQIITSGFGNNSDDSDNSKFSKKYNNKV